MIDKIFFLQSKTFLYFLTIFIAIIIFAFGGQWQLFTSDSFAPHDAIYPISNAIFDGRFGLFSSSQSLMKNFAGFYLHTLDSGFIRLFLNLGFRDQAVQVGHVIACYFTLLSLTYYFFTRIFVDGFYWVLATLAYCFSPFLSVFYSSGIFYVFSTVISLSLIPIFIYMLIDIGKRENIIAIIGCMLIFALNLMFLLPAFFLLATAIVIQWKKFGKELFIRIPAPVISVFIFSAVTILLFLKLNDSILETHNYLFNSAFSNIEGSIFYPLMQISSWAIYNGWQPRAILNFSEYYFSPTYKLLSFILPLLIISYLIEVRKFLLVILLIVAGFFAKGSNFPLGEIFTWVVQSMPFGFMIRTPDTKFSAFIAAIFLVSMTQLSLPKKKVVAYAFCIFLASNLYGLYFSGALSAQVSSSKSTSYIPRDDYAEAAKVIEQHPGAIVLSAAERCTGAIYNEHFHTCADPVLAAVKNQVLLNDGGNLLQSIDRYNLFDSIVFFNRNKIGSNEQLARFLQSHLYNKYSKIYDSQAYLIFFKTSNLNKCDERFQYSCVRMGDKYLYGVPEPFYRYYANSKEYQLENGLIASSEILEIKDHTENYLPFMYGLAFLMNLLLILVYSNKKL